MNIELRTIVWYYHFTLKAEREIRMISKEYSIIIVDMDGTLYYHFPVKARMFLYMIMRPWNIKEYYFVWRYRKMYSRGFSSKQSFSKLSYDSEKIIKMDD